MNKNVPLWNQLPTYAHKALLDIEPDYDKTWFDSTSAELRLTILNLYVKMSKMGFWSYILEFMDISPGCLHFRCNDVIRLKQELTRRDDFRSPESSMETWDSAEKRGMGSLHFKHFRGWDQAKVQAHIDRIWVWQNPLQHWITYDSYKHPFEIREVLLQQGWDKAVLTGIAKMR
jgi:hypothetical protein